MRVSVSANSSLTGRASDGCGFFGALRFLGERLDLAVVVAGKRAGSPDGDDFNVLTRCASGCHWHNNHMAAR